MATFEIRTTRWKAFRAFFDKGENIDFADLNENFARLLLDKANNRFYTKTDPNGSHWAPWSERYKDFREHDKKFPNNGELIRSGQLRDSLETSYTAKTASVRSNRTYAKTHQFGNPDKNIPARPFLGLSDEDREEMRMVGIEYLKGVLGID